MKIVVDCMEPITMVHHLKQLGCDVRVEDVRPPHGKGGDYVLGHGKVGIERKHMRDLLLSLIQKRKGTQSIHLFEQLTLLEKNYDTPILLIEGDYPNWDSSEKECSFPLPPIRPANKEPITYRLHHNAFFGGFIWCIRNSIYLVHTTDERESARFIYLYAKKLEGLS